MSHFANDNEAAGMVSLLTVVSDCRQAAEIIEQIEKSKNESFNSSFNHQKSSKIAFTNNNK
ncbi:MAG: hypothetical protein QNJ47_10455 [Nostocaceae cyanobacterium]|nr:hypothetical protein [Nostocaceae cyanobacterium]